MIIAANWKMNPPLGEAGMLAAAYAAAVHQGITRVLFPPAPYLVQMAMRLEGSGIRCGTHLRVMVQCGTHQSFGGGGLPKHRVVSHGFLDYHKRHTLSRPHARCFRGGTCSFSFFPFCSNLLLQELYSQLAKLLFFGVLQ